VAERVRGSLVVLLRDHFLLPEHALHVRLPSPVGALLHRRPHPRQVCGQRSPVVFRLSVSTRAPQEPPPVRPLRHAELPLPLESQAEAIEGVWRVVGGDRPPLPDAVQCRSLVRQDRPATLIRPDSLREALVQRRGLVGLPGLHPEECAILCEAAVSAPEAKNDNVPVERVRQVVVPLVVVRDSRLGLVEEEV